MNRKQPKKSGILLWLLIAVVAVCIAEAVLWPSRPNAPMLPSQKTAAPRHTVPARTEPEGTAPTQTKPEETEPRQQSINLGYGLELTDGGGYTGAYMEDGTNTVVSNVMMIVVRNTGEQDIQLADITALCGGSEYTFRLTNLAAGERALLLDLERRQAVDAFPESAVLSNVAVFETPMELREQTIQISGLSGMLNVKNISDSDIEGNIYIYYKLAATDMFYGGITFRVRIEGGLQSGELRQIPAGHFSPDNCRIIQVDIHG